MGKIVFYEERNFGGRHYVCMSDCSDLGSYFNHCNSIRVESGSFMIYELPSYRGHQYFLNRGEYPDYQRWMGISDKIRSCRMIPMHPRGSYQMRFYERMEFGGQMKELKEDCPNTMDHFHLSEIHSCNVMDGHWLFYDQSNYRGRMYYLRTGEYKRFSDWGGASARVGSIRRIVAS